MTTATGQFLVLRRATVLQERNDRSGRQRVFGDVARLPDGRCIARWQVRGWAGDTIWAFRQWFEQDDPGLCLPPFDGRAFIWNQRNNRPEAFTRLDPLPPTAAERFRRENPELAAELGLKPSPPAEVGLFAPGVTWVPVAPGGLPADPWRSYVNFHCRGAWGEYGSASSVPNEPGAAWMLFEAPIAVQNSAAAMAQVGVIKARYKLPEQWQPCFTPPNDYRKYPNILTCLDVLTVLGPPGSETMASLSYLEP
jgi:hypothetical protein